ncbi:MAG: diaminopimelate decarboxylase [Acidimicrobiia bacterium]|nr:diaminopimelate decarboxylase [Acidimicrobiia bacterium]
MTFGPIPRHLLPDTASVVNKRLQIGGLDVIELAESFGTPLFVYDEEHLRRRCREAVAAFGDGVAYATKAFLSQAMARLAWEEGMSLDVATGGELHVALEAGVPASRLILHGNNKSVIELEAALTAGVGRVVVDSFDELDRIEQVVAAGFTAPKVLVRVNPGVEAHTHEYLQTGVADSKFGFGVASGDAAAAMARARTSPAMNLVGVHAHIGSQVFTVDSFRKAIGALAPFIAEHDLDEISVGGGLGVAYVTGETAPTITEWADTIKSACRSHGIEAKIMAEPGRAIVASAAVTLYTVGTVKDIDSIRTYLAVDGGMSDNPRPVLYDSGYEAFLPRAVNAERSRIVRVVGKHCEAGDVIVSEAAVPGDIAVGDILCTPVTGAYGHSMGSNYNMVLRPPVVFVDKGRARLVVRRETYDDLTRRDV